MSECVDKIRALFDMIYAIQDQTNSPLYLHYKFISSRIIWHQINSIWTHYGLIVDSQGTHCLIIWTHYGLILERLKTHYGLIMPFTMSCMVLVSLKVCSPASNYVIWEKLGSKYQRTLKFLSSFQSSFIQGSI